MKKTSKPAPVADPGRRQAVTYARVSSKEQEKEGFSIPAQLKLLKEYAATNGFTVVQEYVDVETAKHTGRAAFSEMVAYLKAHPSVRVMLVEKTDRLYRNLKDWVTMDDLDVEMHFPKEGVVLSRESRSSEKFMHGIKVLMAKNYIDNLSEEARKGMQEKAEQGIWPTKAPLGYRNIIGPDGKKIIAVDTAVAPIVAKLFDLYASGGISLKEAAKKAQAAGLVYAQSGAKVPVSTVHTILRNRLYTGQFEWNGKLIEGKHEPLVSIDLWERVQGMMDGRHAKKSKRGKHDFAFSGLIASAARWSARSRKSATSIIIALATPISARATRLPAAAAMSERNHWKSSSPCCSADSSSMTRCWPGCVRRSTPATSTSAGSKRKPSLGCAPNWTASRNASMQCTWTSSTAAWTPLSSTRCRLSGARSKIAASARSTVTRMPTSPTWTRACRFSNWRGTPNACSSDRNRARNAACSTSYYRTAPGRTARWSPPSVNHLIC